MISIIIPVYNIEKYIEKCLDSILDQTYEDFEVIIVDDGSTDSSGQICDSYARTDNRIKVIHIKNGGASKARNIGIEYSSGDWITFVDGDDYIESTMLAELHRELCEKNLDAVSCDFRMVSEDSTKVLQNFSMVDWNQEKEVSLSQYLEYIWNCAWGWVFKRRMFEEYKLTFPENVKYCEDFHLMVRLCFYAKSIGKVDKVLYNYRQHSGSILNLLNVREQRDDLWVYCDIVDFFKNCGVYSKYKRQMNWRLLNSLKEVLLIPSQLDTFENFYVDGSGDIWSCPYINTKVKILAWMMTHHLRPLVVAIDKLRILLGR